MAMGEQQRQDPPELAFVRGHLDTVLQGVTLSYSQYRQIDEAAMTQLSSAGFGRGRGMMDGGRERCGGMSGMDHHAAPDSSRPNPSGTPAASAPGSPGTPNSSQPNASGTGSNNMPGSTGGMNHDCMPGQGANSSASWQSGGRRDSLDSGTRQRLMPVIDQIDSAIRPMLSSTQQRQFDRNLSTWRSRRTASN
jgi:hypothetical protein